MSIALPGHSAPNAGFEAPLEMLAACHGRIEHQCQTLRRLAAHLPAHGADVQTRDAALAVMRYFDNAARDHHADEELDLFPALLESMAGSDAICLRQLTQALCSEHRELEQRWQVVRSQLERVAAGNAAALDAPQLEALISAYERHIAREDRELLPMAARLLSDTALQDIGRAMRERRGIQALP